MVQFTVFEKEDGNRVPSWAGRVLAQDVACDVWVHLVSCCRV